MLKHPISKKRVKITLFIYLKIMEKWNSGMMERENKMDTRIL